MKIIRYKNAVGEIGWAEENDNGPATCLHGDPFGGFTKSAELASVQHLLAPIVPAAIFCIGLNYRQHAAETNAPLPQFPVLFMKSPGALQHPGGPIVLPRWMPSTKVDYECELAVVIGRACKNVSREHALNYVLGYTCANDVSARDWQKEGGGTQWCRGKTFDTFAPLGPRLVTPDEIPNPNALRIQTRIGAEALQDANTSDMIFDIPTLIEFLSGSTTLLPGTVILTGTPSGVGMARNPARFLQPGDEVTIEIENIGVLTNPVRAEEAVGASAFTLI
ncbi:MAG: fumarylacetoacetate hydrolase family protein [Chthoniobacteraceae bacterium]